MNATQIKITDVTETITPLTDGLIAVIVLGDLSLDPGWVRASLEAGIPIVSAGRRYELVADTN